MLVHLTVNFENTALWEVSYIIGHYLHKCTKKSLVDDFRHNLLHPFAISHSFPLRANKRGCSQSQ